MSNKTLAWISWFIFGAALFIIFIMAQHQAWRMHLIVDPYYAYYDRMQYYFAEGSLTNLPFNEYQPGAIFFFVLLGLFQPIDPTRNGFANTLVVVNLLILGVIAALMHKRFGWHSVGIFGVFLAASGPLLLFRFEPLVHLISFLGFLAWEKGGKWRDRALALFAFATSMKVYPVLFLLILVAPDFFTKKWRAVIRTMVMFGTWLVGVVALYCLVFQVSPMTVASQVLVHESKPFDFQSVVPSFLAEGYRLVVGRPPAYENHLIHGFTTSTFPGPAALYLYFWLLPVGWLVWKSWRVYRHHFDEHWPRIATVMIALFILCATQFGPQYFYWYAFFLPAFFSGRQLTAGKNIMLVLLFAFILILTQFVYPLFFTSLTENFLVRGDNVLAWKLLLLRNVLLTLWTVTMVREVIKTADIIQT